MGGGGGRGIVLLPITGVLKDSLARGKVIGVP